MSTFPHPLPPSPPPDADELQVTLPARPENVAVVRRAVSEYARRAGLDRDAVADVALAVSEACANVVVHAYDAAGTPASTTLEVRAAVRDGGLTLVVCDHGHGMAPRTDSPGLGLGLPLMASLASSLELQETPGGGTEVWMTFALRPSDAPAPIPFDRTA